MSNQTLSWQWKVQRRSSCPINECGFPSSQYAGVQHVCTLTAASCKRTCQCKQLLFERIKITLRPLGTNLELNPVNTGVLRIDLQRHLLHTRKTHLSRICNDFKPNYMQHLRSTILAQKHKQQQQKMKKINLRCNKTSFSVNSQSPFHWYALIYFLFKVWFDFAMQSRVLV